jgi:uncharacterized protein (TIGR03545 family)
MHWPNLETRTLKLGSSTKAGIAVAGGNRELWVQVRRQGEALKGRLVSKQTGVSMSLDLDPRYAGSVAAKTLADRLAAVDRIEIDARFEGTWKDLDLQLDSNLGQILSRATREAIEGQVQATRQQLASRLDRLHQQQSNELRQWLVAQQGEARSLLAGVDRSIEEMNQKVMDEFGDADAYLGKLRTQIRGRLK